ncbi:helix-turn-helix transcriptional regulator [Candidimonas nitroreducens]|uniref:AraC family transcriptional regulator n=1 Tax=Candidimonas nitroreducens TaxID=683354 RepID=A0A225MY11_9BURK|nr:AraC family transcriptional regulator [Candidimonas nitroreducens]OWT66277.1 AraC family transcriptional regulator [Candidimonas nitroreducens]
MPHTSHRSYGWELPSVAPCVSLSGGVLTFSEPEQIIEDNEPGLKLAVILGGHLSLRFPDEEVVGVAGPAYHVTLSETPYRVQHRFGTAEPLQYVTVRMPLDTLANDLDLDPAWLSPRFGTRLGLSPAGLNQRANKAILALGRQMLSPPIPGPMRTFYLAGKALELTATVMAALTAQTGTVAASLRSSDVQRLNRARDIVLQRLQSPPTLPELARLAGLNVNKLSTGFRQAFGHSVYEFVRDQRLLLAHQMLAAGDISVAEAAHACGYTDSHFTKVFRKRYGIAPSLLR